MKIQEIRDLISKAQRDQVEKAFAECYKQLPKHKKEEVDVIIQDIFAGKDVKKREEKVSISFEDLEREIEVFLSNAYAQNYYAPNRVIPKSQRPKWRFQVKGYIKELSMIGQDSEYHSRMLKLLRELYQMLCYACNYYIFSTEDPFRSIGWQQSELFEILVKKTFEEGYSKESIKDLVLTAATGGLSRESLHIGQEIVLVTALKTTDVKYMAIEETQKLVLERQEQLKNLKKYDNKKYYLEDAINQLCNIIFLLSIELAETDSGIKYYFANSIAISKEVTLYRALDIVKRIGGGDDLWLKTYQYGLSQKIKPREELAEQYWKLLQK